MSVMRIIDLRPDKTFDTVLLVVRKELRQGGRAGLFLDLTLCDASGRVPARVWDNAAAVADTFEVGDVVLLVTDGFFEWTNRREEQFGIDRLCELALRVSDLDAEQILARIRVEVTRFSEGTEQADDLTAVVIKRVE